MYDQYAAGQLTRLYRTGKLTVIHIPREAKERVREVAVSRDVAARSDEVAAFDPQIPRPTRIYLSRRAQLAARALRVVAPGNGDDIPLAAEDQVVFWRVLRPPRVQAWDSRCA